jgi:glycogen phosphorylase
MKNDTNEGKGALVGVPAPISSNGNDVERFKNLILWHLQYTLARDTGTATRRDWWLSVCEAVEDEVLARFSQTMASHNDNDCRRVYYLSLEYLMGRLLLNNIINCGMLDTVKTAITDLGISWDSLIDEELDMGLGNGGLGRLAACFLDSLATLDIPAVGYGIHYQFGLFRQKFVDGNQVERPDNWRQFGNPWEILRPEYSVEVQIYGHVEHGYDDAGDYTPRWTGGRIVLGVPSDVPICGYGGKTVNFLRLWEAKSSQEFDLHAFNEGGYVEAIRQKALDETISKVLYPNDKTESGKELRLVQQYFFVCCSLKDIIRRYQKTQSGWDAFPEKVAIQLNDTHPALGVAELMRILLDDYNLAWNEAWTLVRKVFSYTNHTLLPEALEKWSVPLFEKVLPRHLQIIYEINQQFLATEVEARWPGDDAKKRELSIIEEGHPRMVRMAYLSVVGSHTVNGVAALHTQLLKKDLFHTFDQLYPGKLQNKTNGITPRRWLVACNPDLTALISSKLGDQWPYDLDELKKLESFIEDAEFRKKFMDIKLRNKERLASEILKQTGVKVDPRAMFDVQIKRLHEYKRQHLNLLHILHLYRKLVHNPDLDICPRVFIFGAKAAPGYDLAKNIIRAINKVADKVNNDSRIQGKLKVIFMPNYSVSQAEVIIPAADLSEQISTAGKEASGTGNMKLALNGALTIGTLDGANVEIEEEVGSDNIFIFGLKVEEVVAMQSQGYNPWDYYYRDPDLRSVIDWLSSDVFTPGEVDAFMPIRRSLLDHGDPYMVLADFAAYCDAQNRADRAFKDQDLWARMAILNTARVGKFSSDRTISEYCKDIWKIQAVRS